MLLCINWDCLNRLQNFELVCCNNCPSKLHRVQILDNSYQDKIYFSTDLQCDYHKVIMSVCNKSHERNTWKSWMFQQYGGSFTDTTFSYATKLTSGITLHSTNLARRRRVMEKYSGCRTAALQYLLMETVSGHSWGEWSRIATAIW